MTTYRIRFARNAILQRDYRSNRIDRIGKEIAYWTYRRDSSNTAAERVYCSKMVAMYLARQKWYVSQRKPVFLQVLENEDKEKILSFIGKFTEQKTFYLEGFCYYFAVILRERFSGDTAVDGTPFSTELWYNPIQNHFSCRINGTLFDAQGLVRSTDEWLPWLSYREEEPLDSARTVKYCIHK